jgi:hypothetical protein
MTEPPCIPRPVSKIAKLKIEIFTIRNLCRQRGPDPKGDKTEKEQGFTYFHFIGSNNQVSSTESEKYK